MRFRHRHSNPFNHTYLLICILSGLHVQSVWAVPNSVIDVTLPVTGHAPTASPTLDKQNPRVGEVIKVTPYLADIDNDGFSLANTRYDWQVDDGSSGWKTVKSGSSNEPGMYSLTVLTDHLGRKIRIGVRPSNYGSVSDPYLGEWAYSIETAPVSQGHAPEAKNVTIAGTATVGQQLTGNYTFSDADSDIEQGSTYKWYRDGQEIPNAKGKTYTIVSADQGKKLTFGVTPKTSTGMPNVGAEVKSPASAIVTGHAPVATNVSISGTPTVGQQLTGNYTFSDADGDAEQGSIYKWYRDGQEIPGQSQKVYTLTSSDQHKKITFSVLPKSSYGSPSSGVEVKSNSTMMVFVAANGVKFAKPDSTTRSWEYAKSYCSGLSLDGGGWRMPNRAQLKALYSAYPGNKVSSVLGWPTNSNSEYWTGDQVSGRLAYYTINLKDGRENYHPEVQPYFTVCIR